MDRHPEHRTLAFIDDAGTTRWIALGELHAQAVDGARTLHALDVRRGDVVVLVLGHSPDLIFTFLGALYLGAIPTIFPYLTEKLEPTIYAERVRALIAGSGARAVVTAEALREQMTRLLAACDCRVVGTAESPATQRAGVPSPIANAALDDVAYLQYTSGTSGLHKGVPQTHGAVLRYIEAGSAVDRFTPDDVIVSWLPLYHDLGLVTGLLIPLVVGVPTVLMSPFRWVRDPKVLFHAMHEFRGTLCWMPNFALNHCARTVRERDLDGIDLRHWKYLVLGGETVRLDSQRQFLERFGRHGLRDTVLQSGYGMAENVCAAVTTDRTRAPIVDWIRGEDLERRQRAVPAPAGASGAVAMVSCGIPYPGTEIGVVDAEGRRLPDRTIGEIIVRGRCLFTGYHRRPDLTAQALRDGWFFTGDLGYLADGQLYVCGRRSDVIIVGGRNLYPDDLEELAGTVPGVAPGRVVAFGVADARAGTERVVLVCEVAPDLDTAARAEIERELRRRAAQELDIVLGDVRFVRKGWVIKTSNGKIAHQTNRDKYLRELGAGTRVAG